MLERLAIRDFVLVERAEIDFQPGLNVLTGETGAGKSLLVQAVDLLIGGRADAEMVREGARAAVIEGEFVCKTLSIRAGRMKLKAANPGHPDIVPKDSQTVEIWGVVIHAIKSMPA